MTQDLMRLPFVGRDFHRTYPKFPSLVERASGIYLFTDDGRTLIDAISGAFCVSLGYGNEYILQRQAKTAKRLSYCSPYSYRNVEFNHLTVQLTQIAEPVLKQVAAILYFTSGGEAIDAALRLSEVYHSTKGETRSTHYSRGAAFHGTTWASSSLSGITGMEFPRKCIDVEHLPQICSETCQICEASQGCSSYSHIFDDTRASQIASIIVEPLQHNDGCVKACDKQLVSINRLSEMFDIPLIIDEVVTGIGRCGSWFASEGLKLSPDILVLGKGLTSGYDALSALILGKKFIQLDLSVHGTGYPLGNTKSYRPAAASAASATIDFIASNHILENVSLRSQQIRSYLATLECELECIRKISGEGLLICIHLSKKRGVSVSNLALEEGLLCSIACTFQADYLEIVPPLVIDKHETDSLLSKVALALRKYNEQPNFN